MYDHKNRSYTTQNQSCLLEVFSSVKQKSCLVSGCGSIKKGLFKGAPIPTEIISVSGETAQLQTPAILALISTAAAGGRALTIPCLFKEPHHSVPITPHFTFYISSHLSEPEGSNWFIILSSLLYTHCFCHVYTLGHQINFSQSLSYSSFGFLSTHVSFFL